MPRPVPRLPPVRDSSRRPKDCVERHPRETPLTIWAPVTYSSRPDVVQTVWEKLPPADINRPHVSGIADKLGYAAVYGPGHGDWATAMGAEMEKAWAGKASFDEGLAAAVKAGDKVLEDNNRELGLKK